MKNIKLAIFTKYSRIGASSRLRSYQYFDNGCVAPRIFPLYGDSYIKYKYKNNKSAWWLVFFAYLRRLVDLTKINSDCVVIVEKELFPWLPWWFERIFYRNAKVVIDIDDAVFHYYERPFLSFFLGKKFFGIFKRANVVLAGNEYLKLRAIEFGAKRVVLFPTVVSVGRYFKEATSSKSPGLVEIVWIGTPYTQNYLIEVINALDAIYTNFNFKLKVIGAKAVDYLERPFVEIVSWTEESEIAQISQSDIGIMPLPDKPFERGKCGYKLIQYMACGLPVVASPVGVNTSLVHEGANGFLCSTESEWVNALSKLLLDKDLRVRYGQYGKSLVSKQFSLERQRENLFEIISYLGE